MQEQILSTLEAKIAEAIDIIETLRAQIEELEQENSAFKSEQQKWKKDLIALIHKLDQAEIGELNEAKMLEQA